MFNSIVKKTTPIMVLILALFSQACWAAEAQELYVEEAYPTWVNKMEVIFSNQISEVSLGEDWSLFRIESVSNPDDYYDVLKKELDEYDKTVMILTLSRDFADWEEYRLVVLKVEDIYGQSIKYWVDSEATFVYRYNNAWWSSEETDWWMNSAGEEPTKTGSTTNWEKPKEDENKTITCPEWYVLSWNNCFKKEEEVKESNVWWTNVDAKDIENQVDVVAKDKDKLPTAWPEHVVIIALALLLGWVFYVFRSKES